MNHDKGIKKKVKEEILRNFVLLKVKTQADAALTDESQPRAIKRVTI